MDFYIKNVQFLWSPLFCQELSIFVQFCGSYREFVLVPIQANNKNLESSKVIKNSILFNKYLMRTSDCILIRFDLGFDPVVLVDHIREAAKKGSYINGPGH